MPYKDPVKRLACINASKEKAKEGRKLKDALIKDGFNEEKLGGLKKGALNKIKKKVGFEDDIDDSAYAMLEDMRWVYQKVRGRNKLKKFVEADDKNFVVMVKELMKIETSLLAAKVRKGESAVGGQQSVFVILKGLEDGVTVKEMTDKDVDLRQIQHAINPNADLVPYEEERNTGDEPDEIIRVAEKVDDEPIEAVIEDKQDVIPFDVVDNNWPEAPAEILKLVDKICGGG